MPTAEFGHIVVETLSILAAILIAQWGFRRQDKKERQEIREKAEKERAAQHKENQDKMDMLIQEQEERPAHEHVENQLGAAPSTPLTVRGLRYGRRK